MKLFLAFLFAILIASYLISQHLEEGVDATKDLGQVEQTSGGTWTTRIQVQGANYPLVGNITVAKGTAVVLQTRNSGSQYVCDATALRQCFKVRSPEQTLGIQTVGK